MGAGAAGQLATTIGAECCETYVTEGTAAGFGTVITRSLLCPVILDASIGATSWLLTGVVSCAPSSTRKASRGPATQSDSYSVIRPIGAGSDVRECAAASAAVWHRTGA